MSTSVTKARTVIVLICIVAASLNQVSVAFTTPTSSVTKYAIISSSTPTFLRSIPVQEGQQDDVVTKFTKLLYSRPVEDNDTIAKTATVVDTTLSTNAVTTVALLSLVSILAIAEPANAVTTAVIPNALVAYTHYLFLLVTFGILLYERFTVAPGMSPETEKALAIADATYGLSGLIVVVSGYYRAVEYGKGWEFYSHEPIFWLKIASVLLFSSLSFFPTITFIKRSVPIVQGKEIEPMSEELATRLKKVMNAEISAILVIPLFATLMARGVAYNNEFPWQAGAAFASIVFAGSAFVYVKQALTWTEPSSTMATAATDNE